jgi:hypothetical protein
MQTAAGDKPTIIEAVVCGVRARAAGHLAADLASAPSQQRSHDAKAAGAERIRVHVIGSRRPLGASNHAALHLAAQFTPRTGFEKNRA